jgi:hypothetical protein
VHIVAVEGYVFKQQTHQKMSDRELIHAIKNKEGENCLDLAMKKEIIQVSKIFLREKQMKDELDIIMNNDLNFLVITKLVNLKGGNDNMKLCHCSFMKHFPDLFPNINGDTIFVELSVKSTQLVK